MGPNPLVNGFTIYSMFVRMMSLTFIVGVVHIFMSLLSVADPETPSGGGGANSLINYYFFSVNITIYRNKV